MAQEQVKEATRDHDPSIEEILASIQQIIAEGDEARESDPPPGEEEEPITLTERLDAPPVVPEPEPEPEPEQEEEPEKEKEEIAVAFAPETEPEPEEEEEPPALITPAAADAARGALDRLASHMVVARAPGRTLEDVTRDLLAPMLREWLDANLPGLIERLVREEIERITRRGA